MSERTVRTVVKAARKELRDKLEEAYVPLEHDPGEDAQVDFYEAQITSTASGNREKVFVLVVVACYSGRVFRCVSRNQTQEALLEGLIKAMHFFDGMFRKWWFDNLTPAVAKVLASRGRILQPRFAAFLAHYGIDVEFCGVAKGNEKGQAEADVRFSRLNALTPVPEVTDWREVQPLLDTRAEKDLLRRRRGSTIGELWEQESPTLLPLRPHDFEVGVVEDRTVTKRSWIQIGTNFYSVPVELVGEVVSVRRSCDEIVIHHRGKVVGRHERLYGREKSSLKIEHYLPLLQRKSRAVDRAVPVRRWMEQVPSEWRSLLEFLRAAEGEVQGSKSFIKAIELAHRHGLDGVTEAVRMAVRSGSPSVPLIRFYLGVADTTVAPALNYPGPRVVCGSASDYEEVGRG